MIIYNVTVNIDESIHEEWLSWIKNHIPQVLATGKFIDARLTKVLVEEEMGGVTYAIQYRAKSREDLDNYYKFYADKLKSEALLLLFLILIDILTYPVIYFLIYIYSFLDSLDISNYHNFHYF